MLINNSLLLLNLLPNVLIENVHFMEQPIQSFASMHYHVNT